MLRHHKIAVLIISVLAILMLGLHFFLTQKAAYILQGIVREASGGKYELAAGKVRFSYLSETINATEIKIHPVVESSDRQSYHLDIDTIRIELRSIWPLIFKRSLDIQDLTLSNPTLVIRGKNNQQKNANTEFNLHENLLIIQEQIDKVIHDLSLEKFRLDNLSLRIYADQEKYFQIDRVFLHIDDLVANVSEMNKSGNLEINGSIHLWLDKPNLVYPDSNLSVSLDHFDWQSQEHNLTIQNIGLAYRQEKHGLDSFQIQLHQVSFSKLQWAEWIKTGHMNYDSIAASKGEFYLQKLSTAKKDTSKKSSKGFLYLISPITIKHFAIREVRSSVQLLANGIPVYGSVTGDSLIIEQLDVDIQRENPVRLGTLDLAIRQFDSKDRDEQWQTSFASFRIRDNHVLLRDYSLKSKKANNSEHGNMIKVPIMEMKGLSIPELAMGKLAVRELTLESPFIQIASSKNNRKSKTAYRPFKEIFPFLNIQSIYVRNGSFVNKDQNTGAVFIQADGINGHIYANKLLAASSLQQYPTATDVLGLEHLQLNLPKFRISLNQVTVNPLDNSLTLHEAKIRLKGQEDDIRLSHVRIDLDSVRNLLQDKKSLYIKKISADSGMVKLDFDEPDVDQPSKKPAQEFPVFIRLFNLGTTSIDIKRGNQHVHSYLRSLELSNIGNPAKDWHWDKLEASFGETSFAGKPINIQVKSIHLDNESASTLEDIQINFQNDNKNITASVPKLLVSWPIHNANNDVLQVSRIVIQQPEINIGSASAPDIVASPMKELTRQKDLDVRIDSIHIFQPHIHFSTIKDSGTIAFQSNIQQVNISQSAFARKANQPWGFDIGNIFLQAGNTSLQKDSSLHLTFGGLQTSITDLHRSPSEKPLHLTVSKFSLDSLQLEKTKKGGKTIINSRLIALTENTPIVTNKDSLIRTIYGIPSLELQGTTVVLDNVSNLIQFHNINANLPAKTFSLDSFSLQPKISRDSFFISQPFQKDYITIRSGAINASLVNIVKDGKDTGFTVNKLGLDNFYISPERDMRRPVDTLKYRPLLANMLRKIPINIAIDTINLSHSTVWHNVIAEKTGEEGTIFFTDINGWIGDVRNFRITAEDSLRIRVYAKMMGKGYLYMRFRESYSDSLQGFILSARMGKLDMPELNRIMVPLVGIKIVKGQIDTMWLQAKANDLIAFGEMQIDYHRLKVEKLGKNEKKQGFISWLANIIVRTGNNKKGSIYVERLQNKAIFNYWGKIALSGLLTNIRVASNKRNKKKYEAALKKYQLPAHLLDED